MKGKIFKIKNAEDELVLPITTTEAVYSEDGKTLNDEIKNINSSLDNIVHTVDGYINVKSFICDDGEYVKGDGVHDDTSGMQRAIDYCFNRGKVGNAWDITQSYTTYKLKIPMGKYRITSPLKGYDFAVIHGDGRNSTLIMCDNCNGVEFDNNYNFEVADITFFSNNRYLNSGVVLKKSARFILKNVCTRDFKIGYDFHQGFLGEIYSPYIHYCSTGIKLDANDNGNGCHAITFYGGEIAGGLGTSYYGLWLKYGNAIKTYGTSIEGFEKAIYFANGALCSNILIDSCYLEVNKCDVYSDDTINFLELRNCFIANVKNDVDKEYIVAKSFYGCKIVGCTFSKELNSNQYHIKSTDLNGTLRECFIDMNVVLGSGCLNISKHLLESSILNGGYIRHSNEVIENSNIKGIKYHLGDDRFCKNAYKNTGFYVKPYYKEDGSIYYTNYHNYKQNKISKGLDLVNQPLINCINASDNDSQTVKDLIAQLKGKGFMYSKPTVKDNFLRYHSTNLNATDNGYIWNTLSGSFGAFNGYSKRLDDGVPIALSVIDIKSNNVNIEFYMNKLETQAGGLFAFRVKDINSFLFLYVDGADKYGLYRKVNGNNSVMAVNVDKTAKLTDKINIITNGNDITLKVNDEIYIECSQEWCNTETKHGLFSDKANKIEWSSIKIETI